MQTFTAIAVESNPWWLTTIYLAGAVLVAGLVAASGVIALMTSGRGKPREEVVGDDEAA